MGKDQLTIQQTGSLKKKVTIIGGGACALMLACELNPNIFDVSIYSF
jgi:aspartate oxidase